MVVECEHLQAPTGHSYNFRVKIKVTSNLKVILMQYGVNWKRWAIVNFQGWLQSNKLTADVEGWNKITLKGANSLRE